MQTLLYTEREIAYDGTNLSAHWIYRQFDINDNALVAFLGEADVKLDHMVDLEDVKKKAPIYSPRMLHFLAEWFEDSLDVAILRQHLFVAMVRELLSEKSVTDLTRRGNDLYFKSRKLSVSIATRTPVSTLMHFGINIETDGTPIPTAGLNELNVNPTQFAQEMLNRFALDYERWRRARVKVSPR